MVSAAGCRDDELESGEPVVARIGDEVVTRSALEHELERRTSRSPAVGADPDAPARVLEEMIEARVQIAAARARGLDESPEYVHAAEQLLVRQLRRRELSERLDAVDVGRAQVEAAYLAEPERFTVPERLHAAIVEVKVPNHSAGPARELARSKAEALLAEARATGSGYRGFGPIAARHSDDRVSRYKGGDVGWFEDADPGRLDPAVHAALVALESAGDIGPVVETESGFHLVMLIERAPAQLRPLEQVAPVLHAELVESARAEVEAAWFAAMASEIGVETDAAVLATVEPPRAAAVAGADNDPPRPPGLPR
jgi:peptidyl-prolyl cis-trans isomerase C